MDGLTSRAGGNPNEWITIWRVYRRMGGWVGGGGRVREREEEEGKGGGRGNRTRVTNSVQPAACVTRSAVNSARPTARRTSLGSRMRKSSTWSSCKAVWSARGHALCVPWLLHRWRWCCGWLSRCRRSGFSKPLIRFPSLVGRDAKFCLFVDPSERKIVQHSEGRGDVCCGMLICLVPLLSSYWNLWLGLDGAHLAGEAFRMQGRKF